MHFVKLQRNETALVCGSHLSLLAAHSIVAMWHHHQAASVKADVCKQRLCLPGAAQAGRNSGALPSRFSSCGHLMWRPLRASLTMSASASAVMPSYSMPLPLSSKLRRVVFICDQQNVRVAAGHLSHRLLPSAAWLPPAPTVACAGCLRDIAMDHHCQRASSDGHSCSLSATSMLQERLCLQCHRSVNAAGWLPPAQALPTVWALF